MRVSKQLLPRLEPMESKALLSTVVATAPAGGTAAVAPRPADHNLILNGTLHGHYSSPRAIPDVPREYNLFGAGRVRPLHHADVTGHLHTSGLISPTGAPGSHAGGQLFLSDTRGTVTLTLEGPTQSGFANLPERFAFKVTGGTGAYKDDQGHGTIFLVLDPSGRHGNPTGPSTASTSPLGATDGSFTLMIVSDPPTTNPAS